MTDQEVMHMHDKFKIKQMTRYKNKSYSMTTDNHAVKVLNEYYGCAPIHRDYIKINNHFVTDINLSNKSQEHYQFEFKDGVTMWCTADELFAIKSFLTLSREKLCDFYYVINEEVNELHVSFR